MKSVLRKQKKNAEDPAAITVNGRLEGKGTRIHGSQDESSLSLITRIKTFYRHSTMP
jgi:hypothetical protein